MLKSYHLSSICELYQHQIFREVRLHAGLQHENVVKLYAAFKVRRRPRVPLAVSATGPPGGAALIAANASRFPCAPPRPPPACLQEGDRVIMVLEYINGGDLFGLLQKHGGRLGEKAAVQLVLDPFLRVMQARSPGWEPFRGGLVRAQRGTVDTRSPGA